MLIASVWLSRITISWPDQKRELRMCAQVDVFEGPATQVLGTETGDGVVYSVSLRRVRYGSHTNEGHLQWNTQKIRNVKAGTIEKLVEHLAPRWDQLDVSYRACFLSTYRTFTTPDNVLQLLLQRFHGHEPNSTDTPKDAASKAQVQSHVTSFLSHWLESYPLDFHGPPSHPLLGQFHTITHSHPLLQRTVDNLLLDFETRDLVNREQCGVSVDSGLGVACEDSDPGDECNGLEYSQENFDLCTLSPQKFAQCLTTEDTNLFRNVIPYHCLDYVRAPKVMEGAPSVRACIHHFNRVSLVVIATVLKEPSPKGRGLTIERWVEIASECRAVKNFSSLRAIISGLQSSAVYRLKRSWESVSSSNLSLFQELSGLLATDDNHQTSRNLLTKEGTAKYAKLSSRKDKRVSITELSGSIQGVVPYLGMFLTDLTMLHNANKDLTQGGLVNFEKCKKLFELLVQLTLYQKSAANYQFPSHSGLVHWLHNTHTLTEAESYQMSKNLEPDDPPPTSSSNGLHFTSRIGKQLKTLFSAKGAVVGDSHSPLPPPSHTLMPTSPSQTSHYHSQLLDASISTAEQLETLESKKRPFQLRRRSNSVSPTIDRRYDNHSDMRPHPLSGQHVIRVALMYMNHCNYKSFLVSEGDRAGAVIERVLKKFSMEGNSADYSLVQRIDDRNSMTIPHHANVYFALNTTTSNEAVKATLLLVKKET